MAQLPYLLRQLRSDHLLLSHIARHLRIASQHSFGITQRTNDHIGPEERTILAHPPSLFFEPARLPGNAQGALRGSLIRRARRIKTRKMLADNPLARIPLDPLRPAIPALDATLGIEHVDRVILHPFDKVAESLIPF